MESVFHITDCCVPHREDGQPSSPLFTPAERTGPAVKINEDIDDDCACTKEHLGRGGQFVRVEDRRYIPLDEITRQGGLACRGPKVILQGGEGAYSGCDLDIGGPKNRREVEPGPSSAFKDQESAPKDENDEGAVD